MTRFIPRFCRVLLLFCLVVDPGAAAAFQQAFQPALSPHFPVSRVNEESLTARSRLFFHGVLNAGPTLKLARMVPLLGLVAATPLLEATAARTSILGLSSHPALAGTVALALGIAIPLSGIAFIARRVIRRERWTISSLERVVVSALLIALLFGPVLTGVQGARNDLLERAQAILQLPDHEFQSAVDTLIAKHKNFPHVVDLGDGPREFHDTERYIGLMRATPIGKEALAVWIASDVTVIDKHLGLNTAGEMVPVDRGFLTTGISAQPLGTVIHVHDPFNPLNLTPEDRANDAATVVHEVTHVGQTAVYFTNSGNPAANLLRTLAQFLTGWLYEGYDEVQAYGNGTRQLEESGFKSPEDDWDATHALGYARHQIKEGLVAAILGWLLWRLAYLLSGLPFAFAPSRGRARRLTAGGLLRLAARWMIGTAFTGGSIFVVLHYSGSLERLVSFVPYAMGAGLVLAVLGLAARELPSKAYLFLLRLASHVGGLTLMIAAVNLARNLPFSLDDSLGLAAQTAVVAVFAVSALLLMVLGRMTAQRAPGSPPQNSVEVSGANELAMPAPRKALMGAS